MSDVLVIGAGLAGGLLSLALAEKGLSVSCLAPPERFASGGQVTATSLSYGGMPASEHWPLLERRHGPLGLRSCELQLHSSAQEPQRHPYARIDAEQFADALPKALDRIGVNRAQGVARRLQPAPGGGWSLELADGERWCFPQVVLAAGAGCRALWPGLSSRLRVSWAGVLALQQRPDSVGDGAIVMPLLGRRQELERRATGLTAPEWVVDAGLAPFGQGLLLGQTSLVRPGLEAGSPPDPLAMERALRQELALLWPDLAAAPARFQQMPIAFTADGDPLVGPVPGAPGLWVFVGFSGPFALVPALAPPLAEAIAAAG